MTKEEKEVYQKTIELYNGCCAICGNNQIQMHHIRYGNLRGGRKTYLGNVIPLCKKHHDLVHTNKKKYMPELIKMIDEKLQKENQRLNNIINELEKYSENMIVNYNEEIKKSVDNIYIDRFNLLGARSSYRV